MRRYQWLGIIIIILYYLLVSGMLDASLAQDIASDENFPFYPSLLKTVSGKPVKHSAFMPADKCQVCHQRIYSQWRGSMHSNAYRDPVWQRLWEIGSKETNGAIDKLCIGCHTPTGLATGSLLSFKDTQNARPLIQNGVQCDVCHSIVATSADDTLNGRPGNASIILDPSPIKRGPYSVSPMLMMMAGHQAAYSEIHTQAELCANCHSLFNPQNNHPIANTYNEWEDTIYARNNIVCQDCHMVTAEEAYQVALSLKRVKKKGFASERGPKRDSIHDHYFVGGNFAITTILGANQHAQMARERLSKAAEMGLILPEVAAKGGTAEIKVKVTNVAAGHNLPTGLNELRQMWLEVFVRDVANRVILNLGEVDEQGNIDPQAVLFNARAVDKAGEPTLMPWKMERVEYDHSIPAKESRTSTFKLNIPADVQAPLTVVVFLRYRSFPQSFINELFKNEAFEVPITNMVVKQAELKIE